MSPLISPIERRWLFTATFSLVALTALPYVLASATTQPHEFVGVLLNPYDGVTYLAKMRLGWSGAWLFSLFYTPHPGEPVLVYTYYLFLGHLARWTGLSLAFIYHLARFLGSVAFLLTTYRWVARFFETPAQRRTVWLLMMVGSGLGWVATLLGLFTSDMWVAEAFPFLSLFVNAHFALAAALLLWLLELALPTWHTFGWQRLLLVALLTTLLVQIQPLAVLTIGIVAGGVLVWETVEQRALRPTQWATLVIIGLCALPWLAYDAWVMTQHTVLSGWNAQNLTPSPPLWDALLSGGVPLILAVIGLCLTAQKRTALDRVLLVWFILGIGSLYAPLSLQRRLSLGLWVPLALLAGKGLFDGLWPRLLPRRRLLASVLLALFIIPTNVLIYVATLSAIAKHDPHLFITSSEAEAFHWLAEHAQNDDVVLAGPETGSFVPVYAAVRVVYGHPFETANAKEAEHVVTAFFTGELSSLTMLDTYSVDYVFYGPREQTLGPTPVLPGWRIAFTNAEVTIYER